MTNNQLGKYLALSIGIVVLGIFAAIAFEVMNSENKPLVSNQPPLASEEPNMSMEENINKILLDFGSELSIKTDAKFHWVDTNGKTYLVSPDFFTVTAQSQSVDGLAPSIQFESVRDKIRNTFLSNGYEENARNAWYHEGFLQAEGFEKDDIVCVSETVDYVMGSNVANVDIVEFSVHCSTKLADARLEQTKFIDALVAADDGEGFSVGAVYEVKQEGDYYKISVSTQPGGYSAYLKSEDSKLRVLTKTQEQLYCELIESESIPYSLLEYSGEVKCFEEDGATMRLLKSAS